MISQKIVQQELKRKGGVRFGLRYKDLTSEERRKLPNIGNPIQGDLKRYAKDLLEYAKVLDEYVDFEGTVLTSAGRYIESNWQNFAKFISAVRQVTKEIKNADPKKMRDMWDLDK